ncbi:TPA: DUF1317 family protein, partial [Yersinia enterocolitica]|nr:DUF1317 family protein [Yersinia enterocolitica]HDL7834242.1 DUF1317 family protein [Yersinia enterocolitica]HDL7875094.1 DUF1317 family protein [Yersinia enterocolitica]HDL7887703.1 DUF1317 family protein [Yersinia enterocolitica]HDL7896292.1 DUF1317 family protein [Yersinia enterocolitica]
MKRVKHHFRLGDYMTHSHDNITVGCITLIYSEV